MPSLVCLTANHDRPDHPGGVVRHGDGGGPDLNPIEQVFAKALPSEVEGLKHLIRKAAERTHEATWRRVGTLLDAFSATECRNYLVNSEYGSA